MHENALIEPETTDRPNQMFWRFKVKVLEDLSNNLLEELRAFSAARAIDVGGGIDFYNEVQRFECDLIARALKLTRGNQRKAARLIGLKATTLNAKLKHYGLSAVEISSDEAASPDVPHTDARGDTTDEEAVNRPAPSRG